MMTLFIRHRSGNRQLHLGACAHLAPEIQSRSNPLSPLAHPRYAPMSRLSAGRKDLWIDPFSVIADTHSKLILIVSDLDFDVAGNSVREGIPDHLSRDPVDLILKHRRQILSLAFDDHAEDRRRALRVAEPSPIRALLHSTIPEDRAARLVPGAGHGWQHVPP